MLGACYIWIHKYTRLRVIWIICLLLNVFQYLWATSWKTKRNGQWTLSSPKNASLRKNPLCSSYLGGWIRQGNEFVVYLPHILLLLKSSPGLKLCLFPTSTGTTPNLHGIRAQVLCCSGDTGQEMWRSVFLSSAVHLSVCSGLQVALYQYHLSHCPVTDAPMFFKAFFVCISGCAGPQVQNWGQRPLLLGS